MHSKKLSGLNREINSTYKNINILIAFYFKYHLKSQLKENMYFHVLLLVIVILIFFTNPNGRFSFATII